MKYWLLTTEYPPEYGGGIGTYCLQWSSILIQKGIELTVFILNKNERSFKEVTSDNIRRVEFSPYLKDTSAFLGYETMVSYSFAEITRIFIEKEGPPDWLEAQEYQGIAYYILQRKHLGDRLYSTLKVLVTCHCPSFVTFRHNHVSFYQLPYFWIGEMEKFCMKAADLCIFPSQYLADHLLSRYPGLTSNYSVLHNPYSISHSDQPTTRSEGGVDFIIVGKLSPAKGALNTLEMFDKLWRQGYRYTLKLVGDENYFYHAAGTTAIEYIKKKYASYLKSGLLMIAGALPPEKVRKELLHAGTVIVPSTVENLPYTVIESMASGKIVLASTQGGQIEIIRDGVNGFLFDYDIPNSFEEKIHLVFNLNENEINRVRIEAVNTILKECDPDSYFEKKMELLNKYAASSKTDFPFLTMTRAGFQNDRNHQENQLLSVVIPFFNLGEYIIETIASIDQSSYADKEIIIVNDGSDEEMGIVILNGLRSRPGIRVIDQKHQGLAAARNRGAREANGKYLAFLDADDKVATDYFEKAVNILKAKSNVHFVGCWSQYFDGSKGQWPAFIPEPPFLLYHNMVNSSSLVYKKESFLESGLNSVEFLYGMEDYDSVINMVKNGYYGVVIPEFLFYYRVRKNSMARGFNKSNRLYTYQLLAEKHKQFYATFAIELFGLLNANGPGSLVENPSLDYHLAENIPFSGNLSRKLIHLIKRNKLIRKAGYKIYRLLNK